MKQILQKYTNFCIFLSHTGIPGPWGLIYGSRCLQICQMQVAPSGGQIYNQCNYCPLVAKFITNESSAILWSNSQLMHVAPSGGQIYAISVMDSIPKIRCASGNIFVQHQTDVSVYDGLMYDGHLIF